MNWEESGLFVSVGLVHDERGTLDVGGSDCLDLWEHLFRNSPSLSFIEYEYGRQLLQGQRPAWKCRAGARYLYVDEYGNAQFCSAQRGRPGKPVLQYTQQDIRLHSDTYKGCEAGCSIFCVYRASQVDNAPLRLSRTMCEMLLRGIIAPCWEVLAPGAQGPIVPEAASEQVEGIVLGPCRFLTKSESVLDLVKIHHYEQRC